MSTAAGLPLPKLSRGRFVCDSAPAGSHDGAVAPDAGAAGETFLHAYTDDALWAVTGVRVAFTERTGGVSTGSFASLNLKQGIGDLSRAVDFNIAAVCASLGAAGLPLLRPNQVHGARVVVADDPSRAGIAHTQRQADEGCDAVVVSCQGVAALLCFADCLPLVLVAPGGSFAVVHCGWRGTVARLASASLAQLLAQAHCAPSQINAYLGPYIHQECFEVGADVAMRFRDEFGPDVLDAKAQGFAPEASCHVDLGAAVSADLCAAGVCADRIVDVGQCSACNTDRFYSYRAENGTTGRHGACAFKLERTPQP